MRKLHDEFFDVAEDKKISDKVMMTRTIMTVVVMVVCLAAMSISAYAYFSCSLTSNMNTIKAANFGTDVSISITSTDKSGDEPTIKKVDDRTQIVTLSAGNTYQVTIEKTGTAQTGFCVISAENDEIEYYHTQQIGVDVNQPNETKNSITFTLTVTNDTTVTFYAHWGTSSHYPAYSQKGANDVLYITDGEAVTMNIKGTSQAIPTPQIEPQSDSAQQGEPQTDSIQQNVTTPDETSVSDVKESTAIDSEEDTNANEHNE